MVAEVDDDVGGGGGAGCVDIDVDVDGGGRACIMTAAGLWVCC